MKRVFVFAVLISTAAAALAAGCSRDGDDGGTAPGDDQYTERVSPVESIRMASKGASRVTFTAYASWGSSCGSYSRAEVGTTDSAFTIKIYGKEPKNAVCLAVMTTFEAPVTVFLPSPGAYTFKFWRSDSTSLDTTFTIK